MSYALNEARHHQKTIWTVLVPTCTSTTQGVLVQVASFCQLFGLLNPLLIQQIIDAVAKEM